MKRLVPCLLIAFVAFAGLPRPAVADDNLTVVGGSTSTGFFEIMEDVAQLGGFYKEQHLVVQNEYTGVSPIAAQLVASGKADICSLAIEPLIQGYDKGLRLQAFFSRDPVYDYALGVLDSSPIHTLADFKGTTIGEIAPNSPGEISANSMLQGAGLKKGDVSYIPIGTGAQAISALTSGKVSGAAFPYPELALYEAMGHVKFRFFHHPILKDIPNVAYAATPATIAAKGDILKRFVRAHVEAAIFIRENPEAAARMFVQGSGLKVTPEAIQDEINLLGFSQDQLPGVDPTNQRIGYMPLRGLNVYANFMAANGLANSVVPASAIVTNDFIAYGNDFNRRAFIARARATH